MRGKPIASEVDLGDMARLSAGFSGADLENLMNEAAIFAARRGRNEVRAIDFQDAFDRIVMGPERKSRVLSEEDKELTAYHEAGHALVARLTPGTDPLHKVSIIPRGMALGITQQLPIDDKYTYSREHILNTLAVLMGASRHGCICAS